MGIGIAVLVIGVCVLLSVWATVKVIGDEFSERGQKAAQLTLVWLVPLLGALIVLGVHRQTQKPSGGYHHDADCSDVSLIGPTVRRTLDVLDGD